MYIYPVCTVCTIFDMLTFDGMVGMIKRVPVFFLMIMLACSAVFAQKRSVAVVAAGEEPKPGLRKGLETQITMAFVKDGRYAAAARDEAALAQVDREHIYQRGGAVDGEQIKELGKQVGAQYICAVEISPLMNSYTLNAKLIDIETAEITGIGSVPSALKNAGDFLAASEALVRQLLGYPGGGNAGGYGSGVFLDEGAAAGANPLYAELTKILRQKAAISDGTCVGGVTAAIEGDRELSCSDGMVGVICRADVSLVITQCKGGKQTVHKGSVVGSDKTSAAAARKQAMRNIENANFWSEWVKELEKWGE
jgi:hypothetical protein